MTGWLCKHKHRMLLARQFLGKPKLLENAIARRTAHRVMVKKKRKGSDKKHKALNMQRIGESRWRPLELCYWPDQGALPAKRKEYPGLGYKRLRDKPPKAQEQQQQPAEAQ
ncbi:hypothetical protein HaLaN_14589 [Haematococcus lacustris]|uniref:Uncharacterized protein n=1 Tax=Haematococcus lacustris TaxID=44745 RepID=A0A699Z8V8_HAELA|nr:hypothetical protein HaLaN_14589 [Haematococcus lacustris]